MKIEAHRFVVATIDEDKAPTAVLALVEGADWDSASRFAFSLAREEVHRSLHTVTGVYEILPERAKLIATAGYARFSSAGTSQFAALAHLVPA